MNRRAEEGTYDRQLVVADVIDRLREVYTDEGVEVWLRSRPRDLGGARPKDLLSEGHVEVVSEAVERLRVGAS